MKFDDGRGNCPVATLRFLLFVGGALMGLVILTWSLGDRIRICTSDMHVHPILSSVSSTKAPWDYNWDSRGHQINNSIPSRIIILIRHGKYDFTNGLLVNQGKEQANYTGKRLAEMNWPWEFIQYSPMDRARETAEIIKKHLPKVIMQVDGDIREGGPIPPKPTITWWGLPKTMYHEDGPRMEGAFRKIFHRPEQGKQTRRTHEIYVGHANIFRFFVLRALQFPAEGWMRMHIPHGSISVLHIQGDGIITMDVFGSAGYMPHSLISY